MTVNLTLCRGSAVLSAEKLRNGFKAGFEAYSVGMAGMCICLTSELLWYCEEKHKAESQQTTMPLTKCFKLQAKTTMGLFMDCNSYFNVNKCTG